MDHDAGKTLFLEQAAAFYDDLKSAASHAPYGKVIDKAELFAIVAGRELIRSSLEAVIQGQITEVEQEQKNGTTYPCGGTRRHRGYTTKQVVTALNIIKCKRVYKECRVCLTSVSPADEPVGITGRYTVGLRRLAVKAGTMCSFDKAAENLEEFCGIKLSDNTIHDLCQKV